MDETEKKNKIKEKEVRLINLSKPIETVQRRTEIAANAKQDALFRDAAISCEIPVVYEW